MIVLDTNVISELEGRTHSERILAWLDDYAIERIFLTTITVGEVRYGIALLPEGKRRQQLASTFDRIEAAFSGRILDFSLGAAHLYATISAARKNAGRSIETKDAMIAAICLSHGATLATRNTKDFEGLDLVLINPFEGG